MATIRDGYGHIIEGQDLQDLAEVLHTYKTFDDAAPLISLDWTRHHIHKEIKSGRVFLSDILIIEDEKLYSPFSRHKKMFITLAEIERIKAYVAKRPKRTFTRCEWCKRILRYCEIKPCPDRERTKPEYQQSVETVERFFARHIEAKARGKRTFTEYTKTGKRKSFTKK
jgi:hypothetical protein